MGSRIEYYRPKNTDYYSITFTLFIKSHQRIGVSWQLPYANTKPHTWQPTTEEEVEERYMLFDLPINGTITIDVVDTTKRSYIQQNFYKATEEGIIFDESQSENLFVFIPIKLIDLKKMKSD